MTQITIGESNTGTINFAGSPPSSLTWGSSGISGTALFDSDVGSYTFGSVGNAVAGPLDGGNFPTSAAQAFSYAAPDGDALSGTVQWSLVKDHSVNPDLIGTMSINSVSGDAAFTTAFHPGDSVPIDLALRFVNPGSPLLDDLAGTNASVATVISSGEIVPSLIPEPATLLAFGVAFAAVWLTRKSRGVYTGRRETV